MPRLRARMAAWLVPPPVSVTMPATSRVPSVTTCEGSSSLATRISGPVSAPVSGCSTSVRWPLSRIITSRTSASRSLMYSSCVLAKQLRVLLEQAVQRGLSRLPLVDDPAANLGRERRIAQDRLVDVKDGGLFRPDLAGHFLIQGVQVGRGPFAGLVVAGQFGQRLALFQPLRLGIDENLVDAVRRANSDARRDADPFSHVQIVAMHPVGNNKHGAAARASMARRGNDDAPPTRPQRERRMQTAIARETLPVVAIWPDRYTGPIQLPPLFRGRLRACTLRSSIASWTCSRARKSRPSRICRWAKSTWPTTFPAFPSCPAC